MCVIYQKCVKLHTLVCKKVCYPKVFFNSPMYVNWYIKVCFLTHQGVFLIKSSQRCAKWIWCVFLHFGLGVNMVEHVLPSRDSSWQNAEAWYVQCRMSNNDSMSDFNMRSFCSSLSSSVLLSIASNPPSSSANVLIAMPVRNWFAFSSRLVSYSA